MDTRILVASSSIIAYSALVWWYFFGPRRRALAAAGEGMQELSVTVKGGYSPSLLVLRKGVPARINFTRNETSDCSEFVVIPDFNVSRKLPAFEATPVEFMPDRAGEFRFTCGMGMYQGTLIVEDEQVGVNNYEHSHH
ncbi:MAG: cupredoxin domain-containing protein [Armatimonadota bacterium]|nr:cupredoxin domain-containing protein [Armatimonadota bacterium]